VWHSCGSSCSNREQEIHNRIKELNRHGKVGNYSSIELGVIRKKVGEEYKGTDWINKNGISLSGLGSE